MFSELGANRHLAEAIEEFGIAVREEFQTVSASTVIIDNPSVFRFETSIAFRIVADNVLLVMHENPVNSVGQYQYDVERILRIIKDASFCNNLIIAPISEVNRTLINRSIKGFPVAANDWFNIMDFEIADPKPPEADRRGRHSRPGPEKWPDEQTMLKCFPDRSDNFILGADWVREAYPALARQANLYNFGTMPVDLFLNKFDFFVYYHAPAWRESFGRVVAEAVAAGKVVICEKYLARTFGEACIAIDVDEIDRTVSEYLDQPTKYIDQVIRSQNVIRSFSRETFESNWSPLLEGGDVACA